MFKMNVQKNCQKGYEYTRVYKLQNNYVNN